MGRVIHFEINAGAPERVATFYEQVFGWQVRPLSGSSPYWLITTGDVDRPGIDGGMMQARTGSEQPLTAVVRVENLDDALERLRSHGGLVTIPPQPVPGVGLMAYGTDPEGREFGLMQLDESV